MTSPRVLHLPAPHDGGALSRTPTSYLGLRVPDVAGCVEFYTRVVGLRHHADLAEGGARLGWGAGHHVLDLLPGPRALDHIAFEVQPPGGLENVRRAVESVGIATESLPDSDADGFRLRDPDDHCVHFHRRVDRSGEHGATSGRRPVRYQHVTLATSNLQEMLDFYIGTVGFRPSDRMGDEFVWLRSTRDHHTFALVQADDGPALDHYSFDLTGWEDMKTWCDRLVDEEVDVTWGPGRHGPGNNLFVFFDDPAGNRMELSAEMERFHDDRVDYPVRRWAPVPASINLWGGQLAAFRTTSQR